MRFTACRLCKDTDIHRPMFRFGIRHYCHAECGLARWGSEFVRMIPEHEIGQIPYRALLPYPEAEKLALELTKGGPR